VRKRLVPVALGVVLTGAGIAIARYEVPSGPAASPGAGHSTTTAAGSSTTTTSVSASARLPGGRYDIRGSPGRPALFLLVTDQPGNKVTVNVAFVSQDGSLTPKEQFSGTATSGMLTLTDTCVGCSTAGHVVSANYGPASELPGSPEEPSIFFGDGQCAAWDGPAAIQDCIFFYSPD